MTPPEPKRIPVGRPRSSVGEGTPALPPPKGHPREGNTAFLSEDFFDLLDELSKLADRSSLRRIDALLPDAQLVGDLLLRGPFHEVAQYYVPLETGELGQHPFEPLRVQDLDEVGRLA